jgi:hypothetical protein
MSAREIADMSGQIWDHLPAMLPRFREEKVPVPRAVTTTGAEGFASGLVARDWTQSGATPLPAAPDLMDAELRAGRLLVRRRSCPADRQPHQP